MKLRTYLERLVVLTVVLQVGWPQGNPDSSHGPSPEAGAQPWIPTQAQAQRNGPAKHQGDEEGQDHRLRKGQRQ